MTRQEQAEKRTENKQRRAACWQEAVRLCSQRTMAYLHTPPAEAHRWSNEQIAARAGVNRRTLQRWMLTPAWTEAMRPAEEALDQHYEQKRREAEQKRAMITGRRFRFW